MDSKKKIRRTVQIAGVNKKGYGRGLTDTGGTMVVPFTIPGEEVIAERTRRRDGELVEIVTPSPARVTPVCKHYGECGGCIWQHIDYPEQLKIKQRSIANRFKENLIDWPLENIEIETSAPYAYRNRMDFVWWFDGQFGLRKRGKWFMVENLHECHLLPEPVMAIALEVNKRVQEAGLPFRDGKYKKRGMRYLVIRHGIFTNEVMLNFVTDPMDLPSRLWEGLDSVVSVYQMVNANLDNDQSDGDPYHLWGEPCYRERILDCDFSVSPRSFFQPNPAMAQRMVSYVRDLWISDPKPRRLVDLYCGLGLFSVLLSDLTDATLGIELVEEAISLAKINGQGKPIEFRCLDAESVTEEMWTPYNTLLIDPPRMGLHPKVIDAILASPFEEIISVSCNPSRGIEDIAKLRERYELRSVKLFDQFPQTQHVEMIACMRRI